MERFMVMIKQNIAKESTAVVGSGTADAAAFTAQAKVTYEDQKIAKADLPVTIQIAVSIAVGELPKAVAEGQKVGKINPSVQVQVTLEQS